MWRRICCDHAGLREPVSPHNSETHVERFDRRLDDLPEDQVSMAALVRAFRSDRRDVEAHGR